MPCLGAPQYAGSGRSVSQLVAGTALSFEDIDSPTFPRRFVEVLSRRNLGLFSAVRSRMEVACAAVQEFKYHADRTSVSAMA
jgi:hypothetical protein